jgi:hypothetical protein
LSLLPQADCSFHILITSSVNYTPHGTDQYPEITSFVHKIGALHTHSTASHSLSYLEFNRNNFTQLLSISPSLFSLQLHASMEHTHGSIMAIINHYEAALRVIAATFIINSIFIITSTFDSINWTLTATMATHAIRHCYTSSTRNACNWCNLVIFLV